MASFRSLTGFCLLRNILNPKKRTLYVCTLYETFSFSCYVEIVFLLFFASHKKRYHIIIFNGKIVFFQFVSKWFHHWRLYCHPKYLTLGSSKKKKISGDPYEYCTQHRYLPKKSRKSRTLYLNIPFKLIYKLSPIKFPESIVPARSSHTI